MPNLRIVMLPIAAGLATLAIASSPSFASSGSPQQLVLATSAVNVDRPGGDLEGTLNITIAPNGGILGYFRPVDSSDMVDVHGSLDGGNIELYIADESPITGTYRDGSIEAYQRFGRDLVKFTATRARYQRD